MFVPGLALSETRADCDPPSREEGHLWAVVLAGTPVVAHSLHHTLRHVTALVRPWRTVVVTLGDHARRLETALAGFPQVRALLQPLDRGTAAAVLLAALRIRERDPRAVVMVCSGEYFALDAPTFMDCVADVAAYVKSVRRWLVLLAVPPWGPEAHRGWIEPGEHIGWVPRGPIHRIQRFREKPLPELALWLFAKGALWSTSVFVASVAMLIDASRRCAPGVHDPLANHHWTLGQAYRLARAADFERAVLESPAAPLAVFEAPGTISP